mmetsp:Transcript_25482/g.87296  ORF Transcript_25482/g.87296 Transcript_25482/m.87296 type:complete len:442 (+) Transcript_25482:196-1521(+)
MYQAMPVVGSPPKGDGFAGPATAGGGRGAAGALACAIEEPAAGDEGAWVAEGRARAILSKYQTRIAERTELHLGYPYNLEFDFQALGDLQRYSINNLGDPFIESNYGVHSREFEVAVLDWFADLWKIPRTDYWGYITNCGTEGNLHGILTGREALPEGILYTSRESHYSVMKAARMYRMDAVEIGTLESGEIDLVHLLEKLKEGKAAGRPAILNVNIGTTVKGAVDNLDGVLAALKEAGYEESEFFIHCDGALFGLMIPFLAMKYPLNAPCVDFSKPIGSISVSGHKFIGAPVPCGVVMTRLSRIASFSSDIEYLNSRDATIMGSRNGHAALYIWYNLVRKGVRGFAADVEKCIKNARLLKQLLVDEGVKCMLNDLSSTVVFERPKEVAFIRKWQLACEGEVAHVVVMPSVSADKLRNFVEDLKASRARCAEAETASNDLP